MEAEPVSLEASDKDEDEEPSLDTARLFSTLIFYNLIYELSWDK